MLINEQYAHRDYQIHIRKLDPRIKRSFQCYCTQQGLTLHDAVERLMKLVVEKKINLNKPSG